MKTDQRKNERNKLLRELFVNGATAQHLMTVFKISRQRLYQLYRGVKRKGLSA